MSCLHNTKRNHLIFVIMTGMIFSSCSSNNDISDAYGNFESDEVIISAEESGRLLFFSVNEGDKVALGDVVGLIDTTMLSIKRDQLMASRVSLDARLLQISKTASVQQAQLDLMKKEFSRAKELSAQEAITTQKYDQIEGETRIAQRQLEQILSQNDQIKAEQKVVDAQIASVDEQIRRCSLKVSSQGTVLQKYVEQGEMVAVGKPLFKVADMQNVYLRAYVSGSQLPDIKIDQSVTVRYDKGSEDFYETKGVIYWVAQSAEFTPKIIQTKQERVDLVYAIKVRVENNGQIKIGMPGEVIIRQ